MKHIKILVSSFLGGVSIAIAGAIYVAINSSDPVAHLLASMMFSFGLLVITGFGLSLYTGKISYLFDKKPVYLLDLLMSFIGNFIGALATGYLLFATRLYDGKKGEIEAIVNMKLGDSPLSIFFLSIMCGILVYLAVESFRSQTLPPVFRVVMLMMSVGIFVGCGFEHVIANIFYFSYGNSWSLKTLGYVLLMALGNSFGAIMFHEIRKYAFLYQGKKNKA